jgi:hypothetical protein
MVPAAEAGGPGRSATMSAIRKANNADTDPITPVHRRPIEDPSAWKAADY